VANLDHVERLRSGVLEWNHWRKLQPNIQPDLSDALLVGLDLSGVNLGNANLTDANLTDANLSRADLGKASLRRCHLSRAYLNRTDLNGADLEGADLTGAILYGADLEGANLTGTTLLGADLSYTNLRGLALEQVDWSRVDLSGAILAGARLSSSVLVGSKLVETDLSGADLNGADLSGAQLENAKLIEAQLRGARLPSSRLTGADLSRANLSNANLTDAEMQETNLSSADLTGANLTRVDLTKARLIGTSFCDAVLAGCRIYGVSTWDLQLDGAKQTNLYITPRHQSEISVDDLEVAQFIYLMLHNEKIRKVIKTITSKVVLILGRFTQPQKAVLDALREALRSYDYVPVLFDFDKPANASTTETVILLARMSRFILADLTVPLSVGWELGNIIPGAHIPVATLLEEGASTFSMASDLWQLYPTLMLPLCRYVTLNDLVSNLHALVITPVEEWYKERYQPPTNLS
jgi:uncharacterized protein YjbI with pentapeptide repeats